MGTSGARFRRPASGDVHLGDGLRGPGQLGPGHAAGAEDGRLGRQVGGILLSSDVQPASVAQLIAATKDKDTGVCCVAIEALGAIGGREGRARLQELASAGKDKRIKDAAAKALKSGR